MFVVAFSVWASRNNGLDLLIEWLLAPRLGPIDLRPKDLIDVLATPIEIESIRPFGPSHKQPLWGDRLGCGWLMLKREGLQRAQQRGAPRRPGTDIEEARACASCGARWGGKTAARPETPTQVVQSLRST